MLSKSFTASFTYFFDLNICISGTIDSRLFFVAIFVGRHEFFTISVRYRKWSFLYVKQRRKSLFFFTKKSLFNKMPAGYKCYCMPSNLLDKVLYNDRNQIRMNRTKQQRLRTRRGGYTPYPPYNDGSTVTKPWRNGWRSLVPGDHISIGVHITNNATGTQVTV